MLFQPLAPCHDKQILRLALVTSAQVNKVHHLVDSISGPTVYHYCLFDQIMRQFLRDCYDTAMKFAKLAKILWINCLHLIRFRPKSGNRTVFGTSFPKRPMVMRLFSWLQQEDTVAGSSPQKTCSRNNSIKKQMYFVGNSS